MLECVHDFLEYISTSRFRIWRPLFSYLVVFIVFWRNTQRSTLTLGFHHLETLLKNNCSGNTAFLQDVDVLLAGVLPVRFVIVHFDFPSAR